MVNTVWFLSDAKSRAFQQVSVPAVILYEFLGLDYRCLDNVHNPVGGDVFVCFYEMSTRVSHKAWFIHTLREKV